MHVHQLTERLKMNYNYLEHLLPFWRWNYILKWDSLILLELLCSTNWHSKVSVFLLPQMLRSYCGSWAMSPRRPITSSVTKIQTTRRHGWSAKLSGDLRNLLFISLTILYSALGFPEYIGISFWRQPYSCQNQTIMVSKQVLPGMRFFVWKCDFSNVTLHHEVSQIVPDQMFLSSVSRGHLGDVYDLCWSSDSRYIVSGSVDNSAIAWDTQKGADSTTCFRNTEIVSFVMLDRQSFFAAALNGTWVR